MVLKQRFSEGRTNYIDIGNNFMYIQKSCSTYSEYVGEHFTKSDDAKDCVGWIMYGDGHRETEPIYKDFPQWIYSNDGQLFMTLV